VTPGISPELREAVVSTMVAVLLAELQEEDAAQRGNEGQKDPGAHASTPAAAPSSSPHRHPSRRDRDAGQASDLDASLRPAEACTPNTVNVAPRGTRRKTRSAA
jgi:hypothetical protein